LTENSEKNENESYSNKGWRRGRRGEKKKARWKCSTFVKIPHMSI
jgi:hypothetical protein